MRLRRADTERNDTPTDQPPTNTEWTNEWYSQTQLQERAMQLASLELLGSVRITAPSRSECLLHRPVPFPHLTVAHGERGRRISCLVPLCVVLSRRSRLSGPPAPMLGKYIKRLGLPPSSQPGSQKTSPDIMRTVKQRSSNKQQQ